MKKIKFGTSVDDEMNRNVVYGVIFDKSTQKYGYAYWENFDKSPALVGGGIDEGEDREQGLRREIKEETGYEALEKIFPLDIEINTHYFSQARQKYIFAHALAFLVIVDGLPNGHHSKEEHETDMEFRWGNPDTILDLAGKTSFSKPFINMVVTYLKVGIIKAIEEGFDTTNNINDFTS